jgi:hypothetical protein
MSQALQILSGELSWKRKYILKTASAQAPQVYHVTGVDRGRRYQFSFAHLIK